MNAITVKNIIEMPIDQRIQFVEGVWDSIASSADGVEIPQWHKKELEKRLASYQQNSKKSSSWADVKKRVLG